MEELGTPDLTTEQIEALCETAENAAKKHVLSKVSSKNLEKMEISVEAKGIKPLNLAIEINLMLSSKMKNFDADTLVHKAVKEAFKACENYLSKIK